MSHAQPVGGTIDTSTAIWEIELTQKDNKTTNNLCVSKLIIIDIPSLDIQTDTQTQLNYQNNNNIQNNNQLIQTIQNQNIQSNISLFRSLNSFIEVIKRLKTTNNNTNNNFSLKTFLAPFSSSKLTTFLTEIFGGDSIIIGFGLLNENENKFNYKLIIDILNNFTQTIHYPVSSRRDNGLNNLILGLKMKYRSIIIQLQDQILTYPYPNDGTALNLENTQTDTQPLVIDGEIITNEQIKTETQTIEELIIEKNELLINYNNILEILELLKVKYQNILNEKIIQNEELIQVSLFLLIININIM